MEVASILTVLVLNIFLPTLDTFTDIKLVTKLYIGAPKYAKWNHETQRREPDYESEIVTHPVYASVLLVPFLLNYVACWYTFYREARYKKYTFIFPLLNLYPQFGKTNISMDNNLPDYYFRGFKNCLHPLQEPYQWETIEKDI